MLIFFLYHNASRNTTNSLIGFFAFFALEFRKNLLPLTSEPSVKYREERNLSLGDCYCLALGKHLGLPIYTGDRPWRGLEDKIGIDIKYTR